MTFVRSGKVKDMYDMGNDILKFKFSDRVSAFDVKFDTPIPQKGKILADFSNFWFNKLNLDNHFICKVSEDEIVTTKLDMIPMECIVRGYFYGSYTKRYFRGEIDTDMKFTPDMIGAKFPKPIFDPTTKDEHDVPVTKEEAIDMKLVMEEEYKYLKRRSIEVYNIMYEICDEAGFILVDLKLEFGKKNGRIYLGDSIGPDEYRIWDKSKYKVGVKQESFDKQILRDWLIENGYTTQFEEAFKEGKTPVSPEIPDHIKNKITEKYLECYKKLKNI
mgnify:FL=1